MPVPDSSALTLRQRRAAAALLRGPAMAVAGLARRFAAEGHELARVGATIAAARDRTGAMCARLGLGQYQVRRYDAWYRHVTLCLVAGATSCSTTDLDDRAGQPVPVSPRPGQPCHGRSRGHQPGTARRYSSYRAPNRPCSSGCSNP
jgi:hypothetical protein